MKKILLFILLYPAIIFGQEDNKGFKTVLCASLSLENSGFYVYNPELIIKAVYTDSTQAENKYPEELLISILSADNQKWVDYNTLDRKGSQKSAEHFKKIKKMNRDSNYFVLHHKFEYIVDNKATAILKYYIHLEKMPKSVSAFIEMQKVNDRWYQTKLINNAEFSIMLMRFKSDKLKLVLLGKNTGDVLIDELINQTRSESGGIELSKLQKVYFAWYDANDKTRLDYFIDQNSW